MAQLRGLCSLVTNFLLTCLPLQVKASFSPTVRIEPKSLALSEQACVEDVVEQEALT